MRKACVFCNPENCSLCGHKMHVGYCGVEITAVGNGTPEGCWCEGETEGKLEKPEL